MSTGTCKGLYIDSLAKFECVAGPLYYPDDIDENNNILPVELDNGLCVACIESDNDNRQFEKANVLDFPDRLMQSLIDVDYQNKK